MSRERRVCGMCGVPQGRSMDVRIESWWQSAMGRLLYRTRDHQLEQAVERNSDRHEDYSEKVFVTALPTPRGTDSTDNS